MKPPATRVVLPELLDELAPSDLRACRSRRDLRRVHRTMGSLSILKRAIAGLRLAAPPRHILELGAGDGSLMLRLARAMQPSWCNISLTLVDRHDLVNSETRAGYDALGWHLTVLRKDVHEWATEQSHGHFDLCVACLFLHHFDADALSTMLRSIATKTDAFVACEPGRTHLSRAGSALIGLLGTSRVTREDAVTSVAAGFLALELTALWPAVAESWLLKEYGALPFTHCFTAVRTRTSCENYS